MPFVHTSCMRCAVAQHSQIVRRWLLWNWSCADQANVSSTQPARFGPSAFLYGEIGSVPAQRVCTLTHVSSTQPAKLVACTATSTDLYPIIRKVCAQWAEVRPASFWCWFLTMWRSALVAACMKGAAAHPAILCCRQCFNTLK
jgi:hypothetical protein